MKQGRRRWLAIAACSWLLQILPVQLRPWARAIRNEVSEINDDGEALLFAFGSLFGLTRQAIAFHIRHFATNLRNGATTRGDSIIMGFFRSIANRPRALGIVCAVGAVLLGLAYMALAAAPIRYMLVNALALMIGLLFIAIADRISSASGRAPGMMSAGMITIALATALLATALAGVEIDGAARWVDLGFVHIQPSLVLLPFMIVSFACHRDKLSVVGLLLASLALALQPDRAMSGMLVAGIAAITIFRFDRLALTALIGSSIGFMATLAQADTLPAVPFVDQIFYTSFDIGLLAGLCVIAGTILLVVPAVLGFAYDADNREVYGAFGILWTAAIAAAAIGNYPTPVVGYSGGAILGYVLSLMLLPKTARTVGANDPSAQGNAAKAVGVEPTMRLSHA
jgi:hypothetical protein